MVGIGASAGGLSALRAFFKEAPEETGLAWVVVVHLSPDHESHLAEILQPSVPFPVIQVRETVELEPDRVYVIPPDANLTAVDSHLRLDPLEDAARERAPIDHFFRTMARTHDGDSVGVVLTGTGSDGTLGLKAVKEKAGLTVVQDPNDAEYDGMPQSALATGIVDLVLPVDEILTAIVRFGSVRPRFDIPAEAEAGQDDAALLPKLLSAVRAHTGREFSRYKKSTVLRRTARRMQLRSIQELGEYVELVRDDAEEAEELSDDLLITVTSFFRDPEAYEVLEERVIPELMRSRGPDDSIRVWSVGCATGEEAYSLAILLAEAASATTDPPQVHVFASDLHAASLETGREGFYPGDIAADVSQERLERFFREEDGGYRIRREVREMVVFAPHNVLSDPPFSRIDLVACRNLLIYMERGLQDNVMELFHYALREGGYLFLGSAETQRSTELFQIVDRRGSVYERRDVPRPQPRLPVFPVTRGHRRGEPRIESSVERPPVTYGPIHQRLLERLAPPSLLVTREDRVAHLSENAGRYLAHPGGEVTDSVFRLVREELLIELRSALHQVRSTGRPSRTRPLAVRFNGDRALVSMDLRPSLDEDDGYVVVFFSEASPDSEVFEPEVGGSAGEGRASDRLERELTEMRERLQFIIEEYEASQEELKASNEELQSSNEELRSTMEELETSKEELQSMNEELQTVNQENRHKVEELSQLSADLQNLLAGTGVATLFLDRGLRIMRFTPRVSELFNIRPADRGRPLSDLTHRLLYDGLVDDAREVLAGLVPVEREVEDEDGRWYLTRVLPYRSADDRIEGAVVTLVDITGRKHAEEELRKAKLDAELTIETLHEPLLVLDNELRVQRANRAFCQHFEVSERDTVGRLVYRLGNDQWDIPELRILLEEILPRDEVLEDYEVAHDFQHIGQRVMLLNARRLDRANLILLGIRDVTSARVAEAERIDNQRRQTFLLGLSDALRPEGDPRDVQAEAAGRLGRHLGASRVLFLERREREEGDAEVTVTGGYEAGGADGASISLGELDGETAQRLRDGETWVVEGPGPGGEEQVDQGRVFGVPAHVTVPFVRDGEVLSLLSVQQTLPRSWRRHEVELVEEAARRAWADVERARAEKALRANQQRFQAELEARVDARTEQVRDLSRTLGMAEQHERERISRLLHDDLQQLLYGVEMKLGLARTHLEEDATAEALDALAGGEGLLARAAERTRRLAKELNPPVLKEEGLRGALEWLAAHMEEVSGIRVEVRATDEPVVESAELRILLFHVVRELLFNVAKHAGTDEATVEVGRHEDAVRILVHDSGEGFETEWLEGPPDVDHGVGLVNARERLRLRGGSLDVESIPGDGTRVEIRLPLDPPPEGAGP